MVPPQARIHRKYASKNAHFTEYFVVAGFHAQE